MIEKDRRVGGVKPVVAPVSGDLQGDVYGGVAPSGAGASSGNASGAAGTAGAGSSASASASPAGASSGAVPAGTSGGTSSGTAGASGASGGNNPYVSELPAEFKVGSNKNAVDWLFRRAKALEGQMLSDEDLAKLRRRQAARRMTVGVADMGRALSNLIATSQYAPNAYVHERDGLSDRLQARYEKERAERDALEDKYFNYVMNAAKLDAADKAAGLKAWQAQQAQMKAAHDMALADAADKRKAALDALDALVKQGKVSEQAAKTAKAEIEAKYAERQEQADLALKGARTGQAKAGAAASLASAQLSRTKAYREAQDGSMLVTDNNGVPYRIPENQLNDWFVSSPPSIQNEFAQGDAFNENKTATVEQKKLVVAESIKRGLHPKLTPAGKKGGSAKSQLSIYR